MTPPPPRLAVLTTDTLHHRAFLDHLERRFPVAFVGLETKTLAAPFPTDHPYLIEQELKERAAWYPEQESWPSLVDHPKAKSFESISSSEALEALVEAQPDLIFVFGTGRIRGELLERFPGRLLNLHGGDPERYRGLDSHLWAIYHRDFDAICTSLHHVEAELDTGDLVAMARVPIPEGSELSDLRRHNTELCVDLVCQAVVQYQTQHRIHSRPQRMQGRYYSFMPRALKDLCVRRFRRAFRPSPGGPKS